ncbi:ATP-binding cassette, subfamily B, RaxB [Lentzea fradiae]|uniref:ATP-binding cassette, subfamily B, RaxB n=1 Tax=Lentzea fradiae TaxID=200378 RepID=A0A1G8BGB7_9PSEU|nr:peptidase domain-containing ABC transporter [Lentzea fradiae]SDH32257.1 ATP-binding cassette, subfamily B, RaxB [Lentzea fradiae]
MISLQNLFRPEAVRHRAEWHLGEPRHRFPHTAFRRRRRVPVVHQTEATDCGLACLTMVLRWHGTEVTLHGLRERFPISVRGTTVADLVAMGSALGMAPRAVKAELGLLRQLAVPCVLHWDMNHYVVLESADRRYAYVVDPAAGPRRMPLAEVSKHFTGVALELSAPASWQPLPTRTRFGFGALLSPLRALRGVMLAVFLAACLVEGAALVAPFYLQTVIDKVVRIGDTGLLPVLAAGFGAVVVAQGALTLARSLLLSRLGLRFTEHWLARAYATLLTLPMSFFQARYVSDVISRFRSVREIQTRLSVAAIESIVDGAMGVVTVVILFVYDARLALVPTGAFVLYAVVRRQVALRQLDAETELLQHNIGQQAYLHETIKGIQAVKMFVAEPFRLSAWSNHLVKSSNREARVQRLVALSTSAKVLIGGVENIASIGFGSAMVIGGQWSLGMLFSFYGFKVLFQSRSYALVDKLAEVALLRPHLDQLADVICAKPEPDQGGEHGRGRIESLELRDVGFSYSPLDRPVLVSCSFKVEQGETLAISGSSGAGKSTLIRVLVGLLTPTHGRIVVNGAELTDEDRRWYRGRLGAVMQDDQLLGGTIRENICFADSAPDLEHMRRCAEIACIAEDIERMPLGFDTPCGDMGSTLSGGQRQRILLARALYKRPDVLVLDEATSNLDPRNEGRVFENLRALPMIKILVAHRQETLRMAERTLPLRRGRLGTTDPA